MSKGVTYDADVAVVGLGSVGAMALWELAVRGVDVVGFEQFNVGHDRAGAGGDTRIFRTAYFEGAEYVPLLQRAQIRWRELEDASGRSLLHLTGGLMIGSRGSPTLGTVQRCIELYGLEHRVLDEATMGVEFPEHRLEPGEVAILDLNAGFLYSGLAVTAAVEVAEKAGATIRTDTPVSGLTCHEDGVELAVSGSKIRVRRAIVAAGAWSAGLIPALGHVLTARRITSTWFPTRPGSALSREHGPIFIRQTGAERVSGIPGSDGRLVKVNLVGVYPAIDPDRLERAATRPEAAAVEAAVERLLPDLVPSAVRTGGYMDTFSPDGHGVVGSVEGFPSVTVASGFSGHGFKMAPAMGEIAANVALGQPTTWGATSHLAPARLVTRP